MKTFLIQYGRWFLLAFVAGFILPRANPQFFAADLTANVYDEYNLEDALVAYHLRVNEITNSFLEMLLDPDAEKLGYVSYPSDEAECGSGDNVSTYCLAVVLNDELSQFEESMAGRADEFDLENGDFSDVTSLQTALQEARSQGELVQQQVSTAEDALDLSLAVYNQVQTVYPLHVQFTEFIKNLEDYRDHLGKLRNEISSYPAKFNGATSTECK